MSKQKQYNLMTTRKIKLNGKTEEAYSSVEIFQDKALAEKELNRLRKNHPNRHWEIMEEPLGAMDFPGLGEYLPLLKID